MKPLLDRRHRYAQSCTGVSPSIHTQRRTQFALSRPRPNQCVIPDPGWEIAAPVRAFQRRHSSSVGILPAQVSVLPTRIGLKFFGEGDWRLSHASHMQQLAFCTEMSASLLDCSNSGELRTRALGTADISIPISEIFSYISSLRVSENDLETSNFQIQE